MNTLDEMNVEMTISLDLFIRIKVLTWRRRVRIFRCDQLPLVIGVPDLLLNGLIQTSGLRMSRSKEAS